MNKNHTGEVAGIFTIIEQTPYKYADNHFLYKGVCNNCGFKRIAKYSDLKATTKCTHIRIDGEVAFHKTNWNNKRIKGIFDGMKQRCYNENDKSFRWYGAKGIKVCNIWMDNPALFEEWAVQNGYEDNLTIDRIDENKDYSPDNCRWITNSNNTKYKSTTSIINVNGEEHTGREWAKILGLGTNIVNTYIRKYGLENTIEFIKRYIANPSLRPNKKSKSIYSIYMN